MGLNIGPQQWWTDKYAPPQRSLRFNSSDSAYLSWTPASAGNRKTWTLAFWWKNTVKSTGLQRPLFAGQAASPSKEFFTKLNTGDSNVLSFNSRQSADVFVVTTTQVFRDPSAWYHIVLAIDTTQVTASDRVKIFVNGTQITAFSTASYPSQNLDIAYINESGASHFIGRYFDNTYEYLDSYLADVHFIDGQALDPTSFGEFDANDIWQPKTYTGTYGTNGFHLDFKDNSTAAALGTDTSGAGNDWTPYNLQVVTGGPTSVAAASGALPIYNTTDTYGTTKGTGTRTDSNSSSIVLAIPMDGANNGTTFTDESATIKGSGSAKSITRNGDTKTSTTQSKYYGSSGYYDGTGDYLSLSYGTDFNLFSGDWTIECWINPSSVSTTGGIVGINGNNNSVKDIVLRANNANIQFWVDGYNNITTYSNALSVGAWYHVALVRSGSTNSLYINGLLVASSTRTPSDSGTISSVVVGRTYGNYNIEYFNGYISDLRIYKGVAKYTGNFNPPRSTQNPTIAAGNDSLVDFPTNGLQADTGAGGEVNGNYATLNPLSSNVTLFDGNLKAVTASNAGVAYGTIYVSSGKYYAEVTLGDGGALLGVMKKGGTVTSYIGDSADAYAYYLDGQKLNNNVFSSYGSAISTGDTVGIALDMDAGSVAFYLNGVSQGTAFTGLTGEFTFVTRGKGSGDVVNFGQRPFAYTAPSGFKALCTANLPTPTIEKGSDYFDTKLYTGNGGTQTISGLEFSPDLVWIKSRSNSGYQHVLQDVVRGAGKSLFSSLTSAEIGNASDLVGAFNSDGFSVNNNYNGGTAPETNGSGSTYVAWTWDAGSSTVSNTDGSITSQVRANASAGFSIVKYTTVASTNSSIGHGLNVAPKLLIVRYINNTSGWYVYHAETGAGNYLLLNSTGASTPLSSLWNNTAPTSSVFSVGTAWNQSVDTIAYCFAPVDGYSSFGSYTGNGSTDGPFVFTNHRPRWIMIKNTTSGSTNNWVIYDAARNTYNETNLQLWPNSPNGGNTYEATSSNVPIDILSNGFKIRSTGGDVNTNTNVYIYATFASNPFSISRAR